MPLRKLAQAAVQGTGRLHTLSIKMGLPGLLTITLSNRMAGGCETVDVPSSVWASALRKALGAEEGADPQSLYAVSKDDEPKDS